MMGPQHRLFGALTGAGVATATGQTWSVVAMTALIATSTAHGWSSPDLDQTSAWRRLTAWLPREWAKHRGLTHWPELPLLAWWLIATRLPAEAQWPAYALLLGWASHLLGDALFGRIPVLLGRLDIGAGLDTGGWLETRVAAPLIVVLLAWVLCGAPQDPTGAFA